MQYYNALGTCSDSSVSRFLGKEILHLTQQSDSVQALYLNPMNQDSTANYHLGYAVQDTSQNLTQTQISSLSRILESEASYSFDSTTKNCTLLPDYALVFYGSNLQKQRDTLTVLLDFHCDMWHFFYRDIRKFEDMEGARDSLLALMNEVFSKKTVIDTLELDTTKVKIELDTTKVKKKKELDTTKVKKMKYDQIQNLFFEGLSENSHITNAFLLNPENSVQDSSQSFHSFAVVEKLDSISKTQQDTLLKIIKNKDNYRFTDHVKNCTFLPDVGYRMYNKH